ncbi:thymidine phosphorylase [Spirochaeta isovalerica]|uniref:thymidine phosphorylase n=1 Tax=Spirochaeta isovalerica TaxID=150 RepID=A0A841REQ8_9SPIO|nr:thymidine phosphorylase [Spirochaeta isovalerica]MBB6482565.1 pyrimidine-nucleoside phosphorylase [Spirochaeta isovalerica]
MRAVDIIMKKRMGGELTKEEIHFLITGYVDGSIPEYQISAWLMAVYFKGMTFEETGYLTREMIASGEVLDLEGIPGPLVDKHSTGGVGDKVSIILAPLAAACGVRVPMMSGRALGHTGGTLDKLDTIPGFTTEIDIKQFRSNLMGSGMAMTGQSKEVVPADKKMYALRDVTATVESVPLITASILSKKFAEGAQSLVFDVKCGSGAFMKNMEEAETLATSLVETGRSLGRKVVAVITRMDEPLGHMVGNFLEIEESIDCLKGKGPDDLMDVTYRLTAWMLVAGGICSDIDSALAMCREKIESGEAWEKFLLNVKEQGGDPEALQKGYGTFRSAYAVELKAETDGYVQEIDAFETGMTGVMIGVGRNKTTDNVLPYVGIELKKKCGDEVKAGDVLCVIYTEDEGKNADALAKMNAAYKIGPDPYVKKDMILKEIKAI